MNQFNDIKDLQVFLVELLKLNNLVKCAICLDIVNNPIQVQCMHTFCNDCITALQSANGTNQLLCPLCRKLITRQKTKNYQVKQVAKFAQDVSVKLKNTFNIKVLDKNSIHKIIAKLNSLQQNVEEDLADLNENNSSEDVISASTVSKHDSEVNKDLKTKGKKSSSKELQIKNIKPGIYNSFNDNSLTHAEESSKSLKNYVFDHVAESSIPTRYKNIKTYNRKTQIEAPIIRYNRLIDFEDYDNKAKIIKWLTDSKNCFERETQTQQEAVELDSTLSFNMPSISQDCRKYMKKYSNSIKNVRKSRALLTGKSRYKRRAQSLDIVISSYTKTPVFKRHSLACDTVDFEDIEIEDTQSDINEVVHLMEEDCLNALEMDMNLVSRETKEKENQKRSRRTSSKDASPIKSLKAESGWSRIKEIKKAIDKKERKPKKLNISYTPVSTNSKDAVNTSKKNLKKCEAVAFIKELPSEKIMTENNNSTHTENNRVYSLDEIESYIDKHILESGNVAPQNDSDNSIGIINNEDCIKGNNMEKEKENAHIFKEGESSKIFNNDVNMCNQESDNKKNNEPVLLDSKQVCDGKIAEKNDTAESMELDSFGDDKLLIDNEKQFVECNKSRTILQDKFEGNNVSNTTINQVTEKTNFNEDVFMEPTQPIPLDNGTRDMHDSIEEKLESIFFSPTQKTSLKSEKETNVLQNRINLFIELSTDLNKSILTSNESLLKEVKSHFTKIGPVFNEIHQLLQDNLMNNNDLLPKTPVVLDITPEIKNMCTATTQTVNFDANSMGVQTDDISLGFRISSNASFKTQTSSAADAQTQTDPFDCANCKITRSNLLSQRMPSEVLVRDRDLIKSLADKYEFTQSLDNVQFDTQDMVKATKPKKTQETKLNRTSSISNYEFTQSLDNIEINTCELLENMNKSKMQEAKSEKQNLHQGKQKDADIAIPSSDLLDKYQLNESLDDVCFNSREVDEKIAAVVKIINQKQEEQSAKNAIISNSAKSTAGSRLILSLSADAQNWEKRRTVMNKRFKRIRTQTSDSDSDSENPKKITKFEDIHMRDDISINFISDSPEDTGIKKVDTLVLSAGDTENIDYDEYLEKIMQKYDNEIPSSTPKRTTIQKPGTSTSKITSHQTNMSLRGKRDDVEEPPAKVQKEDNISEFLKIASSTPKRTKIQTPGTSFSKTMAQQTKNSLRSNKSDVVKEPPAKIEEKDKFSESLFSNTDYVPLAKPPPDNDDVELISNSVAEEFNRNLEDDINLGNKPGDDTEIKLDDSSNKKVTILQHVVLKNDTTSKLPYDLEEELAKMERNEIISVSSDDLFVSDSDDIDVVETTPQKGKSPRFTSESVRKGRNQLSEPQDSSSNCLDVPLPPPIEFQDNLENIENELENVSDPDVTLVPQELDKNTENDFTLKENVCPENLKTNTSFPNSEKFSHISPIKSARKVLNPLDVVFNSRFSPLDIVVRPPPQRTIATSTPKQKSILNYVQSSQKYDTLKPQQSNLSPTKKPCIACTRLSKDQVIAISTLTNKKLVTYSSTFHPTVTHMIVSVNEKNCVKDHTIKFVSAVASGIWILNFNWIQECLVQNRIVEEEPFEVLDVSGIPGPKTARLTRLEKPLLKGFRIHTAPPFLSTTRKDIEDIIVMLGGEVVRTPDCLIEKKGIRVIITEARATQDFELYEVWLDTLCVVTVDLEWLSRSVGQYQLLSLRPFTLCSDDTLSELGYPPELLVNTSFSFSQSTYT